MITKYSSNWKVCIYQEYQHQFFSNVCMQIKLVNILTYVQILSYKNGVTISETYNTQHIQFASIMPGLWIHEKLS